MNYDLNQPWKTLDEWQRKYIFETDPKQNCFLLAGRQCGKTAAMAIKAVELCVNHFKEGENILICSITEKQAYRILARALVYAQIHYPNLIMGGKDKPTMHRILFNKGGTKKQPKTNGIYCFAAGETGEGLRGDTIKKLMIDEGSRMSEEFFISVRPMISVAKGSIDIASTPFGKTDKYGNETFFYKCSKDDDFEKFYISAEDCPRHEKEFLENERKKMSRLSYAQEYRAEFLDELKAVFGESLIKECCILKRRKDFEHGKTYYIGVDVAGFGKDLNAYEIFERISKDEIEHVDSIVEEKNYTTDTSEKIIELERYYKFRKIGIDDQGVGFGVYSELMNAPETKRKTIALNNSSRAADHLGEKSKKLLKEEMYMNLLVLMENKKIKLLDDREIKASLGSMQYDEDGSIFGRNSHICEGIIRGAWLAAKDKSLKLFIRTF